MDAKRLPGGNPRVVVIDGEIGAGKTTLIDLLGRRLTARGLKTVIVPEPVEEWKRVGILQEFYEEKPPELRGLVAYDFQTYTFVTRVEGTIARVEAEPDADVYLLERSVLTDRFVFMELQRELVGARRMEMYDRWWALWSRLMPVRPTHFVYLKPSLENCMTRVVARARDGEVAGPEKSSEARTGAGGVSADYQARLREAHEAYLQGLHPDLFPRMPPPPFDRERDVIVVEGALADADFSAEGPAADRIIDHVVQKLLPG